MQSNSVEPNSFKLSRRQFLYAGAAASSLATLGCSSSSVSTQTPSAATVNTTEAIPLNFNENPLGLAPKAQQAVLEALPNAWRYPDAARSDLMATIASNLSLETSQLIYGNGSSEVLKMALDALVQTNTQLVMPDPSYGVIIDYAMARGVPVVKVKLDGNWQTDLATMKAKVAAHNGPSIVYLCNPNNPTGLLLPQSELNQWLDQASSKLSFIVDEAYVEYVAQAGFVSAVDRVKQGQKHIVVCRTFSKIYALAGLRVGYGVAHSELIKQMQAQASIDNANLIGCVAAKASLESQQWLELSIKSNRQAKELVYQQLTALGLDYLPSETNFIFHKVNGDSEKYMQHMQQAGILVGRPFNHGEGWNRLSIGTPAQMQYFCKTLAKFRELGWV
ncbi:pyridoxal phosphate-dependent aminotransferase [Shewanella fidelis]|uniref:Aminotransferase class I/II-fold pyridoxal phosphate-dependent enzyme n=1 Tax=Shewanella fidelis TaxID=173509 RepID=A0AAW8NG02_9GAMM|nr:aminotransferase class I/II-fold pyridoxal phosphate-dependent enzyme [Shewanella fidelis]MDR8522269.1 aminotransferase class I/II-fold pyridoxal phosphate-dependent enzyme [Shewanella fidelis]MDW4812515.1 aminotransferase class I/II-fold pyridoxal phosphate-dependent enzyme [Shewanella fidelis]MDW4816262.1 aminotransferase class I/II-fold pyridoxal phosphate-dependent enzyme [Shewanella fidelis]MDW4820756.1 aminotransferase class I/II-fold pyridoxal phosphate-dependent enzyme [Shewanella fi